MSTTTQGLTGKPHSKVGRMTIWLSATFALMFAINIPINQYLIQPLHMEVAVRNIYVVFIYLMLGCGIAGGICGLIAIIKKHERSLLVWIFTFIGLLALLIFLNEAVQGIMYFLSL